MGSSTGISSAAGYSTAGANALACMQAEDIMRSQLKPSIGSPEAFPRNPSPTENGWLIADRIATLREAFQDTPHWLGFNIELKYPTDAELAVMPTRFYSRNYFCDEVLRVRTFRARTFQDACASSRCTVGI